MLLLLLLAQKHDPDFDEWILCELLDDIVDALQDGDDHLLSVRVKPRRTGAS
eukprot:COSAG06_NODE_42560_length_380_cov_1.288256_1_plen_51_part_10